MYTTEINFEQFKRADFQALCRQVGHSLTELDHVIGTVLLAFVSGYHPKRPRPNGILLEGLNGLAKTVLAKQTGLALGGPALMLWRRVTRRDAYGRINGNPDLARDDLVGSDVLGARRRMKYLKKGLLIPDPIKLVDEINRSPPNLQALMLQAMAEREIKIESLDERYAGREQQIVWWLFVLATQNPLFHEGTYPLPEAALDRFLAFVTMPYPPLEEVLALDDQVFEDAVDALDITQLQQLLDQQKYTNFKGAWHELFGNLPVPTIGEMIEIAQHLQALAQVTTDDQSADTKVSQRGQQIDLALLRMRLNELQIWKEEVSRVEFEDELRSYCAKYVYATWSRSAIEALAPNMRDRAILDPTIQRAVDSVQQGVMPRGAQALRDLARALCWAETPAGTKPQLNRDHIDRAAPYVLPHRLTMSFTGAAGASPLQIILTIREWMRKQ